MSELIGVELGPYRILEQIGAGGMASVFKAYHPTMDRYVAVKVLPEQMGWDDELRQRFQREARVIARLEHVHILPVHDYGQVGNRLYLVMRYIDAGTLKDRIAAGPMDLSEVSRIIRQVGGALDYAHKLGVVHRDIKPSNVLLDTQEDCYLTDFGLAKVMEASIRLTVSGVGMGTPAYMSPEQGQGEPVDARSDVYSLGVVLYEMVTEQVPYQAETPLAVVLKHISAPLPLPTSVKADLPEAVERVILKAMAKDPDDRFQTVGEMVDALDSAVRIVQAEIPTEIAVSAPLTAEPAAPPTVKLPEQAMPGVQEKKKAGWLRAAVWVGGGIILVLALLFVLSRLPLGIWPTGERPAMLPASTATEAMTATAASTPRPTATPSPTPTATQTAVPPTATPTATFTPTLTPVPPTSTPTQTPTPSPTPTPTPIPLAWQRIYSGAIFPRAQVNAVAIDPRDPDVLYAATDAGIHKSLDGGASWRPARSGLGTAQVSTLAIDPTDTQTLYAGAFQRGVYKSTDGGLTWKNATGRTSLGGWGSLGTWDTAIVTLDPQDGQHVYLATYGNVYESRDGGQSWTLRLRRGRIRDLAVDPADGDRIYVAALEGSKMVMFSSKGPGEPLEKTLVGSDYSLDVVLGDPPSAYATGTCPWRMLRSQDGGDTWTPLIETSDCRGGYPGSGLAIDPRDWRTVYLAHGEAGVTVS